MKMTVREMALVSMFAALACIPGLLLKFGVEGAVPFSLLPFVALLSGVLLGARLGALSMVVYLAIGLAGVPVFAVPPYGGLAYLVKPTAGFLFGFIGAAYMTGKVVEKIGKNNLLTFIPACVAGLAVLYLIGLPYMYGVLNYYVGKAMDVATVLKLAFLPFVGMDLVKAVVAALIAVPVTKQVGVLKTGTQR